MIQDHPSATRKPCLDDLLTMMGITREQMIGMTAEDLFAAATRCQESGILAPTKAKHLAPPTDLLVDSMQGRSVGAGRLN